MTHPSAAALDAGLQIPRSELKPLPAEWLDAQGRLYMGRIGDPRNGDPMPVYTFDGYIIPRGWVTRNAHYRFRNCWIFQEVDTDPDPEILGDEIDAWPIGQVMNPWGGAYEYIDCEIGHADHPAPDKTHWSGHMWAPPVWRHNRVHHIGEGPGIHTNGIYTDNLMTDFVTLPGAHLDVWQAAGSINPEPGDRSVIARNIVDLGDQAVGQNAVVFIKGDFGLPRNVDVIDNWFDHRGWYPVRVNSTSHGSPTGVRITGNRFGRQHKGRCILVNDDVDVVRWDNRFGDTLELVEDEPGGADLALT